MLPAKLPISSSLRCQWSVSPRGSLQVVCAKKTGEKSKKGDLKSGPSLGKAAQELAALQQKEQQQSTSTTASQEASPGTAQAQTVVSQPPPAPSSSSRTYESMRGPIRETPQAVVDRMFQRMVTFAVTPVALGILLFPLFYYLKVVQKIDYPLWVVYIAQLLTFGGGLLGITYGVLSSSWDPTREGSFWGWNELQGNLDLLLNRNKRD